MFKNKVLYILCLLIVTIILTSCSSPEDENIESQTLAVLNDIFKEEYTEIIANAKYIFKEASEVSSEKDMIHLQGRIDEYIFNNKMSILARFFSLDESITSHIIIKNLETPLKELCNNLYTYLDHLNLYTLKNGDLAKLNSLKGEFSELSNLLSNINFDGYNEKQKEDYFIKNITLIKEQLKILDYEE